MPTAYELALTGTTATEDQNNKASAMRTFIVDTINPAAALLADGVPGLGTSHPLYPSLNLDRRTVTPQNDGTCEVSCQYSNDQRFVDLRRPNKDNPAWYHWGWAMRKTSVEIPFAIRSAVLVTDLAGAQTQKLVWKIAKKQVSETRVIRPLQVRVQVSNVRDLDVIATQTDKLHVMPDGKTYHFEGGNVQQVDDTGKYDISYTWERDEGTFFFPDFNTQNVRYCEPATPVTPLARYPYSVMVAYQIGDPSTTVPIFDTQTLYDWGNRTAGNNNDGLGWQLLPGADRII